MEAVDWTDEVRMRIKRGNQILFTKEDPYLQDLAWLISQQTRPVLALWAFDLAEGTVQELEEKYPDEDAPRSALQFSKLWAMSKVKMPVARREILRCHALAKRITSAEDIALCHAVGQACSVVHTAGHALGYPLYALTAVVRRDGLENGATAVEDQKCNYLKKLAYWSEHIREYSDGWANFMVR